MGSTEQEATPFVSARLLLGLGLATLLVWAVVATIGVRHGLDLSDESFYVVSYRWWGRDVASFTGLPVLLGPWFDLLSHNIPALRLSRLVVISLVHLDFSLAFVAWFTARARHLTRVERRALVAVLAATSTGPTIWFPPTPGYNDVTLLGAVVLLSGILRVLSVPPGQVPRLRLALCGVTVTILVLSKWTSVVLIGVLFLGLLGLLLRRRDHRAIASVALWPTVGLVASGVAVQVIRPWSSIVDGLLQVNRTVAATSNSPLHLLSLYAHTVADVGIMSGAVVFCLGLPLVVLRAWHSAYLTYLLAVCPILCVVGTQLLMDQRLQGGVDDFADFAVTWSAAAVLFLLGCLLLSGTVAARPPRPGHTAEPYRLEVAAVLALLVMTPWLHGFGSGNSIYWLAYACLAPWLAAVTVLSSLVANRPHLTAVRTCMVAVLILLPAWCAVDSVVREPYRSAALPRTDTPASDAEGLEGILLTRHDAGAVDALAIAVRRAAPEARSVVVLDELPGIGLVLGLPPLGEAWNSELDPDRSHAAIRRDCRTNGPQRPVIVMTRAVRRDDVEALRTCGFDFYSDYSPLPLSTSLRHVAVFVPKIGP